MELMARVRGEQGAHRGLLRGRYGAPNRRGPPARTGTSTQRNCGSKDRPRQWTSVHIVPPSCRRARHRLPRRVLRRRRRHHPRADPPLVLYRTARDLLPCGNPPDVRHEPPDRHLCVALVRGAVHAERPRRLEGGAAHRSGERAGALGGPHGGGTPGEDAAADLRRRGCRSAAIRLLAESEHARGSGRCVCSRRAWRGSGWWSGSVSSLAGVGGGVFSIPMMYSLMHFPLKKALGTSSATIVITATAAMIGYVVTGGTIRCWSVPRVHAGICRLAARPPRHRRHDSAGKARCARSPSARQRTVSGDSTPCSSSSSPCRMFFFLRRHVRRRPASPAPQFPLDHCHNVLQILLAVDEIQPVRLHHQQRTQPVAPDP